MKNFLAILGCFMLAILMITVFASCGERDEVSVDDPDDAIIADATDSAESADQTEDAEANESDESVSEAEGTTKSAGSSFLDTVLGGVEDIVGEALGGAADIVNEALAGAADKVNSALNDENKND